MKRFLLSLMTAVLFSAFAGSLFGAPVGAGVFALSLVPKTQVNSVMMAVIPEVWTEYIVENLFKNNEFILASIDESQYVLQGSVVHIPQAGAPSAVKRNRSTVPATITRRSDIDVTYALDEFTTDPRYIPEVEKMQLSYDKVASCMTEDMSNLQQVVGDTMLYNWRPKYYIKASKTASAEYLIHGTGLRTGVSVDDFSKAKTIFDKWGIPKVGRCVILNTEMYEQLCSDVRNSTNDNLSAVYDHVNGRLVKLEGFKIYERATALLASNSTLTAVKNMKYFEFSTDLNYTPEKYEEIIAGTTEAATTACAIGLFWHPNSVRRAVGETKMFENNGDPTYYGDIYSFLQRGGGRIARNDGKGVLGIIQEYKAAS